MTWHIVYLSYESKPGGRDYIGKHSTDDLYDQYLGSFSDKCFSPDSRIILGVFNSAEAATQSEIQWQRVFEVVPNPDFANKSYQTSKKFDTTGTPAHNKGKPRSEEEKQSISLGTKKALKEMGFDNSGEKNPMFGRTGEKHPSFGKSLSAETKQKISSAKKGKPLTAEHRRRLSKLRLGNQNAKGTKRSEEHKLKNKNYAIVKANEQRIKGWWELNKTRKAANGRTVGPRVCNQELDLRLTSLQILKIYLRNLK
jgi:hypothetical protein